jgi:glycosyltransferase involved in cell wall biosynthesis
VRRGGVRGGGFALITNATRMADHVPQDTITKRQLQAMAPTVSVIIAVYNGARYIETAIRSILNQVTDMEIVVSDDASTDNTTDIVRTFVANNIKLLSHNKNGGIFVNFNRALKSCSGRYIQLFCQDDVAYPGFIKSQLDAFRRNKSAGLVYASCNIIDANGTKVGVCDDEGTPLDIDFATYLAISSRHGSLPPSLSTVMVRRQVFDELGTFDDSFSVAGDLEFYNRVAQHFTIIRNRSLLVDVRSHRDSATRNSLTPLRYMREEIQILPFYRRHLGEKGYEDMMAWRTRQRGADHAKFILRCVLQGRLRSAGTACRTLSRIHNLPLCLWYAVTQKVRDYTNRNKTRGA